MDMAASCASQDNPPLHDLVRPRRRIDTRNSAGEVRAVWGIGKAGAARPLSEEAD